MVATKYKCTHCPNCAHLKKKMFNRSECPLHNVSISGEGICNLFLPNSIVSAHYNKVNKVTIETMRIRERERDEEVLKMPLDRGVKVTLSRALNSATNKGYLWGGSAAALATVLLGFAYVKLQNPIPRIGIVFFSIVVATFWGVNKTVYMRSIHKKIFDYLESRKGRGDDTSEYDGTRIGFEVKTIVDEHVQAMRDKPNSTPTKKYNSTGICPHCGNLNDPRDLHCQKCDEPINSV
jgi:hypothetical protein